MCMGVLKKKEAILEREVLERCYQRNPHGAGFAFSKEGKLFLQKGYFDFDHFWHDFNNIQKEVPALVHFRFASAGEINKQNCHPFFIDSSHAMIHNGTLWDFVNPKSALSDTMIYNKFILKPLFKSDKDFWQKKHGEYLLASTMGYSKMAILSKTGDFTILNESAGEWDGDIWYSNDGYKEESKYCGTCYPRQLGFAFE